jgi:hypothetical protein
MTACSFSCCFTLKDLVILIPKTTNGTFTQCTIHLMTRIAFSPSKSVLTYVAWLVHYQSFRYKREDEADDTSFHFVGYATLYPFFCWPDKIRMRIRYGWAGTRGLSLVWGLNGFEGKELTCLTPWPCVPLLVNFWYYHHFNKTVMAVSNRVCYT